MAWDDEEEDWGKQHKFLQMSSNPANCTDVAHVALARPVYRKGNVGPFGAQEEGVGMVSSPPHTLAQKLASMILPAHLRHRGSPLACF